MRQSWEDALHARFDCFTGDPVTTDDEWGHLQVMVVILRYTCYFIPSLVAENLI